ncbi:IclR family transcriptional regulator domain-containing protein [Falsiroseomonas oryzae]|uniref:IclR family transcriptional regulator domain-containing protein n=1 Tax=Falsiroseomonas oryzae TaxID=2766473 RepID=UPI0022EAE2C4|nr:hypothetical protein [Roseomonas sp. MO-31]
MAAAPVLPAMARETPFPSDVMIRDGTAMETVENNHRFSSLALRHSRIAERVHIPWTAVGRAYLAWCPEAEREEILDLLVRQAGSGRFDRAALLAEIHATCARGFGVRHTRFLGGTQRNPSVADHLDAIAVAILAGPHLVGCINTMWPRRIRIEPGFRKRQLAHLRLAAEWIGAAAHDAW